MRKTFRYTLLSLRDLAISAGLFTVLAVTLLALAYGWLGPNPPKRVTLATGPAQSAYEEFGKRYAKILAEDGIEVVLMPSQGSADNFQLLRDGKVDLGFVQGGTLQARPEEEAGLESLGSLFVEPVWLFYRQDALPLASTGAQLDSLAQLKGLRVNLGTAGSGIPSLMGKLLASNNIELFSLKISELEQTPATVAFLEGRLDALIFASAPESLMVQMLLQTPGIGLTDFPQSEAYSRRFAFLSAVVLPRGVVDLAADIPSQDVRLVAPTTALIARTATHLALLQLFVQAGQRIHRGAGWFKRARDFPNLANNELPIAAEAERGIRNDKPFLQRYLPFWMANLVERMWLAMGIILAIMLPLSRIVPPFYAFRVRSRIFRWYAQLRDIENRIGQSSSEAASEASRAELDSLEQRAEKIAAPLSYTSELYALRSNIQLVRKKLPV